jgi:uncharacterized protein YrrD
MDVGDPISYLTLSEGTPVFAAGGERVGVVEHVLFDADADVFDGVVVDCRSGPGGWRFVDAPEVDAIYERGVLLTLGEREVAALPEPSENPATMSAEPEDVEGSAFGNKLRRAWDYLSGRY